MNSTKNNKNNSPFLMVAVFGMIGILLSVGLVTANPIQQASADNNKGDANTSFELKQKQKNKCSGMSTCENGAEENFAPITAPIDITVPVPPAETPVPPAETPNCEAGVACVVDNLDATQLALLKVAVGIPGTAPNSALCEILSDLTPLALEAALTSATGANVADQVATVIINCLIDAGFTNLQTTP